MPLTPEESQEKTDLEGLCRCVTIPMSLTQFDRLNFLRKKQWENCCSNPRCIGFQGTDEDIVCPHCNYFLYKLKP